MSNDIIRPEDFQTFTFENGAQLRVIVEGGEPLFYAKDVCDAMGHSNHRKALADFCKTKGVTKRDTLTKGGKQEVIYVDEANVYRLIMRSKLPRAEEFQDWVCEVVLPTIRKTGKYEAKVEPQKPKFEIPKTVLVNHKVVYRANEFRYWLYQHGYYRHSDGVMMPVRMVNSTMCSIGFAYMDKKSKHYVATTYALENGFCVNVPIKQFVTFRHDGSVKRTTNQYVYAVTERGAVEFTYEAKRLVKKMKKAEAAKKEAQQKLLQEAKQ